MEARAFLWVVPAQEKGQAGESIHVVANCLVDVGRAEWPSDWQSLEAWFNTGWRYVSLGGTTTGTDTAVVELVKEIAR